jgi:hypothetical protein
MPMGIPVARCGLHRRADLLPGLKPVAFERQRAQNLPPRLDQVEIGGILGLEDELEARMRQGKE